jgi:hypothetical protein
MVTLAKPIVPVRYNFFSIYIFMCIKYDPNQPLIRFLPVLPIAIFTPVYEPPRIDCRGSPFAVLMDLG